MISFENDSVESIAIGRQFELDTLSQQLNLSYQATQYRDAYHVPLAIGEAWVFDYGVIIFWGTSKALKDKLLSDVAVSTEETFDKNEYEKFSFAISDHFQIRDECITLASNDKLERLAASHALAQSSKLTHFEGQAKTVIIENEYIPRQLAENGKIPLKPKELAKLRGTLFSAKSDILLNFNLLDTPDFFWRYPEREPVYTQISKYLDIESRVNVLNKKLETIHELLDMLAGEQNHKHSAFLEWIIILLIAFEVVLFFVH